MTETLTLDPVVKVARDLTEISRCSTELEAQAIADGDNPDIPGGAAMVAMGPVADLELWGNLNDTTAKYQDHPIERLRRVFTSEDDEDDDDHWPPQQVIAYWTGRWRAQRGEDYAGMIRTPASEMNYLRQALPWAVENEAQWSVFVDDVRHARLVAENLVARGHRADRSRIVCDRPTCEKHPQLVKTYSPRYVTGWACSTCDTHTAAEYRCISGHRAPVSAERCGRMVGKKGERHVCGERTGPATAAPVVCCNTRCPSFEEPAEVYASDPARDGWKCPTCKHHYTPRELQTAHARMLWRPEAERWVRMQEAVATLKTQGRPGRTIRKWLGPRLELVDRCIECAVIHPHQEYPACPSEHREQPGEEPVLCGGILEEHWYGNAEAVVEGYCEIATHTTWLWWPDLWRQHLATPTRIHQQTA